MPKTLPEVAKKHELLPVRPPGVLASVSPFVKIAALVSPVSAGST